jgi:hypothetical protein
MPERQVVKNMTLFAREVVPRVRERLAGADRPREALTAAS